ncbi:type I-MYXAN CRISPR-associated protein Cas5/Cmx5/DevS [Myxococcus vastator]|uniref:type I-MYXAN CRISPR-associated protein Cas5/Cmx5/DevS n=1 Tax=Myxococcus vastator TaxID=2709664 RepID=UPI0013CFE00E|nr:type I-MYXAN CRISPR-associated protein Cas5/Cmx5/DevS [Myxococcus vastator]
MGRLWLLAQAPFAAFRPLQAGVFRATAPFMTPSAAYGLVLNLAGVETRAPGPEATTRMRDDCPCLRIAVGLVGSPPEVSSLYQQLHTYPVGSSGQELKARTHGAKYWIVPVRRELLVGLRAVVGVECDDDALLGRVSAGLRGEGPARYGLPFAGDNNLLFDRLDLLEAPPEARWYARLEPGAEPRRGAYRMTVGINREDASRTTRALMAPLEVATREPPEGAWTWTPRAPPS